ncbi:MAG: 6-carboxytetrahydropterin synthase [Ectothiorhodospiraceae bacterium]|jgi:6-pyruvoyltetrahydropterin/6-carboxytetrahydropterin synthase
MSGFTVTRRLEIDAAHRIPDHASKCRHLHGHRYVIEATCANESLRDDGAQRGMVLDFAFLKEEMLQVIDGPCDHGLLASVDDDDLLKALAPADADAWLATIREAVRDEGFHAATEGRFGGPLYVLDGPPTAELLARHWFRRLQPRVERRSEGRARLAAVTVWETPNCRARFEG